MGRIISLSFLDFEIRLREQIVNKNNNQVPLSYREFTALRYLAEHPGWVFSKDQIYEAVYSEDSVGDIDNIIYCLLRGLRKKFYLLQ